LASGDVISSMYTPVASGAYLDVQPAAGVSVLITFLTADFLAGNPRFRGKNAAGSSSTNLQAAGNAGKTEDIRIWNKGLNMKLFINNSEFFQLHANAGAVVFAYAGIEL